MTHYDLIVLGSGSAARDGAAKAAQLCDASVALVESTRWGGSCPNVACKPTKAYLVVAELMHDINVLAGKLGIEVGPGRDRPRSGEGAQGHAEERRREVDRRTYAVRASTPMPARPSSSTRARCVSRARS